MINKSVQRLEDKIIYDKYLPSTKIIISCIEYPPLIRLVASIRAPIAYF